jgi:RES domain-containing protein
LTPLPRALIDAYSEASAAVLRGPLGSVLGAQALADVALSSRQASPDAPGLQFWRLVNARHVDTWDSGEGAFRVSGRWNKAGTRLLYGSLDPATAILEVAVHSGFSALDAVPHMLVCARIVHPALVKVLLPHSFPNPAWLRPGSYSPNQVAFVQQAMESHPMLVVPSAVSPHSWNLLIDVDRTKGEIERVSVEVFSLDTRLVVAP